MENGVRIQACHVAYLEGNTFFVQNCNEKIIILLKEKNCLVKVKNNI